MASDSVRCSECGEMFTRSWSDVSGTCPECKWGRKKMRVELFKEGRKQFAYIEINDKRVLFEKVVKRKKKK